MAGSSRLPLRLRPERVGAQPEGGQPNQNDARTTRRTRHGPTEAGAFTSRPPGRNRRRTGAHALSTSADARTRFARSPASWLLVGLLCFAHCARSRLSGLPSSCQPLSFLSFGRFREVFPVSGYGCRLHWRAAKASPRRPSDRARLIQARLAPSRKTRSRPSSADFTAY